MTINKSDLIDVLAEKTGITKKAAGEGLNAILDKIQETLVAGDTVTLTGFGTFKTITTKERKGINPKTKAELSIPAKKRVRFSAGKTLEDSVQK